MQEGTPTFSLPACKISVHRAPACLRTPKHAAPTSDRLFHQAGPVWDLLLLSSACPKMVLGRWAPLPQRGQCMAAPRQVTPPLGVPALSSLPGTVGSRNGSQQGEGRPPPQWPRSGGQTVRQAAERAPQTHLLAAVAQSCSRSEHTASQGTALWVCGPLRRRGEMCQTQLGSSTASCQTIITRLSCLPAEGGQYFYPHFIER